MRCRRESRTAPEIDAPFAKNPVIWISTSNVKTVKIAPPESPAALNADGEYWTGRFRLTQLSALPLSRKWERQLVNEHSLMVKKTSFV
jgi:hypothetical protein